MNSSNGARRRNRLPDVECVLCQTRYRSRYRGNKPMCKDCRDAPSDLSADQPAIETTVVEDALEELRPTSVTTFEPPPPSPALTALVLNYSPSPRPRASVWHPRGDDVVLTSKVGDVIAESPRRQVVVARSPSPRRFQALSSPGCLQ